ncbi:carph-isopro domain-containing protein [Nitrospirillum sp. BR 11828]|uniref:carph-isopro domain-containing protein n=1 Tax=Nitrospirillum sp. BR 11828 TaxID=3104325 RepID=UPI002ACA7E21|nr:mitofilin family membrane protein [Nitrospirillum sp. BR 11828]MDZ5646446.1 mitofilin family membrane protein [Nitrospirillum sp. BR 11828]
MSGEGSDATSPQTGLVPAGLGQAGANPQVDAIVERFGGIRPMAAKLGIPVTTVQGWKKRGHIPPNRRADLEAAATRLGIPLTTSELDAVMGAPEVPAAPAAPAVIALPSAVEPQADERPPVAPSLPEAPKPQPDRPEPPRLEAFRAERTGVEPPKADPSAGSSPPPHRMETPRTETPRMEIPKADAVRRDPPRPIAPPPRRGGGAVSALALLLSLGALGAGGWSLYRSGSLDPWLIRAGLAPGSSASTAVPVPSAEQAGVEATLAEMARRLGAAAQHQQALEQEVADLKAKLAAAPVSPQAPAADGASVPAAPDPALAARLEQMTDQFNRLTERQRALEQALAQSAQQREELSGRLAAQTAAAGRGQALLVATNQLQAALLSGRPYGVELSAVRGLAPEDDGLRQALDRLAQSQATGLAGPVALREGFDRAATAAQRAAQVPEGADWLETLWGRLKALVTIRRKDGRLEGNAPDAVVSRAGAALDRGDIGTAVAEMSALSGPPAAAPEVQAWLRDAQARLSADEAMARLSRRAVSDVQAGLPAPKAKPVESAPAEPSPTSSESGKGEMPQPEQPKPPEDVTQPSAPPQPGEGAGEGGHP